MQRKVIASERIIDNSNPFEINMSLLELMAVFVYEVSREVKINPEVKCIYREKSVWVLFNDSCFQCETLLEEYGDIIGLVSEKFPITLNGIIDDFETGEIKAFFDHKHLKIQMKNSTGQEFDIISDLCIKIEVENYEELELINELLSRIQYNKTTIAIRKKWKKFFNSDKDEFTKYHYILLDNNNDGENYIINSLNTFQMTELWCDFLEENYTPYEFEILYENFKNGDSTRIFAWELSLRIALSKLNITIEYSNDDFKIVDKYGKKRRYTFESKSAAEKVLLKILFPVNNVSIKY